MPLVLRQDGDTENPILPLVYGKQSTAGKLAYYTKQDGPSGGVGSRTAFISILGEGEMDGVDEVRYNGGILSAYDVNTGQGQYVFHPGTLSTGYADPIQGRPTFFSNLDFT